MKARLLAITLLTSVSIANAQQEKPVESALTNVTVFLNRAQVTREVHTTLEAGKTNVVVTGLSSQLDPESIQVAGKGNFILLGISHRQNFLSDVNVPKPLLILRDSISLLQQQVIVTQNDKEILNKEEQLLVSNQKIGGTNQNLTVTELKAMADFYRARLSEIANLRVKDDERLRKLSDRITRLNRQVAEQNALRGRNPSEIVISLSSESAQQISLEVNYVVTNAGWTPQYDLRAVNTKSPVQLNYKANVFQNTGEEWKNVKLKLSTANPSESGLVPALPAWYLNFNEPMLSEVVVTGYAKKSYSMRSKSAAPATAMAEENDKVAALQPVSDFVTTVQTSLNTEFDISLPYTVVSGTKPTVVDVRSYSVNADYRYSVVPKLDRDAFLLARATGWEEYSLLPGEANIFFEGTFVGKTFINPNISKDTLSISLGRDKRISVTREKVKELTSRKMIGSNRRDSFAWEITVRNNKAEAVNIVVDDQMPVSQNNQIEVTTVDSGGAKYNKDSGKLSWELSLKPGESRKLTFKYEIKYPKDKTLDGL